MTVQEQSDSRSEHLSVEKHTITVTFKLGWAEWDTWATQTTQFGERVPVIGDYWGYRPDMRCTDLKVFADGTGNCNCKVVAIFSTGGWEQRQDRADQIASWDESLDIQSSEESVISWSYNGDYNYTTELGSPRTYTSPTGAFLIDWPSFWKEWGPDTLAGSDIRVWAGPTDDNRPELIIRYSKLVFRISAYGSDMYISRVLNNYNTVNSTPLLQAWSAAKTVATGKHSDDVAGYDDTGLWLFEGAHINRMNAETNRFDFTFLHNADGWNTQHGVTINAYPLYDFTELTTGMNLIQPESPIDLRYIWTG